MGLETAGVSGPNDQPHDRVRRLEELKRALREKPLTGAVSPELLFEQRAETKKEFGSAGLRPALENLLGDDLQARG